MIISEFRNKPKHSSLNSKPFRLNLLGFILFNIILYLWMSVARGLVPFNRFNYVVNSHHYLKDQRVDNPNDFYFLRALSPADAQFFLYIADHGFSKDVGLKTGEERNGIQTRSYAFPPLYPLVVGAVNLLIHSVELSAFLVTQFTLIGVFISIYWLISKWHSEKLAQKVAWITVLYPFSIFFRSYHSEGLFVILLVLLMDSLMRNDMRRSAIYSGLLSVARFVGLVGVAYVFVQLTRNVINKRLPWPKYFTYLALSILPLIILCAVNYINTGNPAFFLSVRGTWHIESTPPLSTMVAILSFYKLPWHLYHSSRVDVLSIIFFGGLVWKSRGWLPRHWWYLGLCIWALPLFTSDTMSASRYQIVNIPMLIYLGHILTRWRYKVFVATSAAALFWVAILFVNWVWIG